MSDEYDAYLLWKLSAQQQIDIFRKETKALRAENAKLRELCAALYEFAYDEYPDSAELNFASRMRELGVEVTS